MNDTREFHVQTRFMDTKQPDGLSAVWSTIQSCYSAEEALKFRDYNRERLPSRPWRVVQVVSSSQIIDSPEDVV